jgi:hypothetical protein
MLTISSHIGNANENHTKIPPHPCKGSHHQKHQQQHVLVRMWGTKNPCILLVKCKLVLPLWKKIRRLKNLNTDFPYDPAIPLLGIDPKECNTGYFKGIWTHMFIAALLL